MRVPGTWGEWSARQVTIAVILLVIFVGVAAVVPVLIQPGHDPAPPASTTPQASTTSTTSTPPTPLTPTPKATHTTNPYRVRPAVTARPAKTPPRAVYQEFPSMCAPVRTTTQAPVTGLATTGTRYDVFGSTATTLAAPGRTPTGTSSCLNPGDRSTYWVPSLLQRGRHIEPESFQILHKGMVRDYTSVQPFPAGLRILAGGTGAAPSSAPDSSVTWACTGYDASVPPQASTCRAGDKLIATIAAPGCWDGRHLDVPAHRSHLAWAAGEGCPASHPVVIPTLLVRVVYPIDVSASVRISGGTYGFGVVTGWQPTILRALVRNCINAGEHCGENGTPD
ncbi:DUF1996 domain-containing protein [Kineosporia sp. NBRC 101731]|uniref:DUF1996 domain-containing protein n=1 Tax=Kineosporia sp. NBRC 101731 TaxID=3032199 RepID=UPI00249FF25E|nr:DUF1996 domain-containing protein [Kineosporia sp. NBRC 101731]GLY29382.1 hypothetical protein Kisp02_27470 [Kineosporia sp. NBRC 101731]